MPPNIDPATLARNAKLYPFGLDDSQREARLAYLNDVFHLLEAIKATRRERDTNERAGIIRDTFSPADVLTDKLVAVGEALYRAEYEEARALGVTNGMAPEKKRVCVRACKAGDGTESLQSGEDTSGVVGGSSRDASASHDASTDPTSPNVIASPDPTSPTPIPGRLHMAILMPGVDAKGSPTLELAPWADDSRFARSFAGAGNLADVDLASLDIE